MWKSDPTTGTPSEQLIPDWAGGPAAEEAGRGYGHLLSVALLNTVALPQCRLLPADTDEPPSIDQEDKFAALIEQTDVEIGELVLGKRKKDVEEEEDLDDEEEEEDDLDEEEDEDEDFEDEEDEDEFEEEFEDDELDDDDDDIFYDDDDDE